MDCSEAKGLIDRWEEGIELSGREVQALRSHLEGCGQCRGRYGALAPFLGLGKEREAVRNVPVPDIVSPVMAKIRHRETKRKPLERWRGSFLYPLPRPALAFLLVLALGGGMYLGVFSRRGGAPSPHEVTVRFTLENSQARTVSLVGDFSDWNKVPLKRVGDRWEIHLTLKKGRVYTYNFIVDDEHWMPDPAVPFRVQDGFGGEASLLQL